MPQLNAKEVAMMNEFVEAMSKDSEESVKLSEEERQILASNPKLLANLYSQTKKAILLHSFPAIMVAQIEKASNGDTTSAKFIADFVEPDDDDTGTSTIEYAQWETLALQLRDRLELEYSAQDTVIMLLNALLNAPLDVSRQILGLDA